MTIEELIERLDIETDCLGTHLKRKMIDDPSHVEAIAVDYELLKGGSEEWEENPTPPTHVIKSFVVWTHDAIYHIPPDEDAFLYEIGCVFKVSRHPTREEDISMIYRKAYIASLTVNDISESIIDMDEYLEKHI